MIPRTLGGAGRSALRALGARSAAKRSDIVEVIRNTQGLRVIAGLLFAIVLGSCGSNGGPQGIEPSFAETSTATDRDALEAELKRFVRRTLGSAPQGESTANAQFYRKKPYFYKAFTTYPEGPDSFSMDFQEQESRTTPYVADVTIPSLRYATKLHRNRDRARNDSSFIRATGTETISYEMRNGRWWRTGSFFMAETREELAGGVWGPVRELPASAFSTPEEPKKGWFGRARDTILFWR